MSTVPGHDAWRDAGLQAPDETTSLAEEADASTREDAPADDARAEEYRPGTARPDLAGEADEADVAEQAAVVPEADETPGPGGA